MKRWLYQQVLWNIRKVKADIERQSRVFHDPSLGPEVMNARPDEIIEGSAYPRWLIKWAIRWQGRESMRSEKPPFSI